jgi:hypothetical protein
MNKLLILLLLGMLTFGADISTYAQGARHSGPFPKHRQTHFNRASAFRPVVRIFPRRGGLAHIRLLAFRGPISKHPAKFR